MRAPQYQSRIAAADAAVPPAAPAWVTAELVRLTLQTWQPYYAHLLTREDAVNMITSVGRLFEALSRGADDETLRSTSAGQ